MDLAKNLPLLFDGFAQLAQALDGVVLVAMLECVRSADALHSFCSLCGQRWQPFAGRRWLGEQLSPKETAMLYWVFVFLVIGLIAALFGFTGVAGASFGIAKFLAGLFLVV